MTFAKWRDRVDDSCKDDGDMAIHNLPPNLLRDAYRRRMPPELFAGPWLASIRAAVKPTNTIQPAR